MAAGEPSGHLNQFINTSGRVYFTPPSGQQYDERTLSWLNEPVGCQSFVYHHCAKCDKKIVNWEVINTPRKDSSEVVSGKWDRYDHYCFDCANYGLTQEGFVNVGLLIRENLPHFTVDTPDIVIADWLEENGRKKSADYMRARKRCLES